MLFADVNLPNEIVLSILGLFGMLMTAIGIIFQQLIRAQAIALDAKDAIAKNLQSQLASRTEMAHEAISDIEVVAARSLAARGKPVVVPLVPVVPEHNSPTTEEQRMEAEAQTLRARLVAAKLALGLPARQAAVMELPEDAALRKGIPFDPVTVPTEEEEKAEVDAHATKAQAAVDAIAEAQKQPIKDEGVPAKEPLAVDVPVDVEVKVVTVPMPVPDVPPEPFH